MLHRDLDGMNVDEASGFLARVEGANVLGRIGRPDEIGDVVGVPDIRCGELHHRYDSRRGWRLISP